MSRKMKMLSVILFAIIVVCSLFNVTTLAAEKADSIQSEIAGEVIASNGKTVVAVILQGKDDILTKSEIEAEYNGVTKWNTKNGNRVSTGDTFSVGSNDYVVAIYGDVDSDGFIDSADALLIERVVVKLPNYSLNEIQRIAADVDSVDGSLNSIDSLRIKKFKVGLENTTVVGNPTKKEDPKPEIPKNLTAVYGQKLSDVKLPTSDKGTYKFEDAANTSVGEVGNNKFSVIYIPNDLSKYKVVRITVTIKVEKAEPSVVAPKGLTATVGQTLADVTLPTATNGTWKWDDESLSVGSEGTHTFSATFTPSDTKNYKPVTMKVTVVVTATTVPTEKVTSIVVTETPNTTTNYCYSDIEVATITATTESGAPATISDAILTVTAGNNATAKIVNGKIVLNATQAGNYDIQFNKKGVAADAEITEAKDPSIEISKITATVKEDETINKITIKDSNGKEIGSTIDLFAGKTNYYSIVFSHDYGTGKRDVPYIKNVSDVTLTLGNTNNALDANATKFYNGTTIATTNFDRLCIATENITVTTTGTISVSINGVSKNITVNVKPIQMYELAIESTNGSLINSGEIVMNLKSTGTDMENKKIEVGSIGLGVNNTIKVHSANDTHPTILSRIFTLTALNDAGTEAQGDKEVKSIKLALRSGITLDSTLTGSYAGLVVRDVLKEGIVIKYQGAETANSDVLVEKTIIYNFDELSSMNNEGNGNASGDETVNTFSTEQSQIIGIEVKNAPTEITKTQLEKLEELYKEITLNVKVKENGVETNRDVTAEGLKAEGATIEVDKSVDGKVIIKVNYQGKTTEIVIVVKAETEKPSKAPANDSTNNTISNTTNTTNSENKVESTETNTNKDENKVNDNTVQDPSVSETPEKTEGTENSEGSNIPEVPETPGEQPAPETQLPEDVIPENQVVDAEPQV